MHHLTLYTQPNCSLCEDALIQLRIAQEEVPFQFTAVDITSDDTLLELYGLNVPVLKEQDVLIQEGNIDFVTIIEYLSEK